LYDIVVLPIISFFTARDTEVNERYLYKLFFMNTLRVKLNDLLAGFISLNYANVTKLRQLHRFTFGLLADV